MSQNKRQKMDLDAACSSASVNTQETSTSVVDGGGSQTNEEKNVVIYSACSSSFKDAVKWTAFVDRTLLINELLKEGDRRFIIVAPRRFGKSLNLDMVRRFFKVEAGRDISHAPQNLEELKKFENYQVFCRYGLAPACKILNEVDLVKEYFGRHPVIHLDFKNVRVSSVQDVKDGLRGCIHMAYRKHFYLKNSDAEEIKQNCRKWCHPFDYNTLNAAVGLQQLMEYLHAYHKRKVYLLVDEFDAPAVSALFLGKSGDEAKNISNVVTALLAAVLKGEVAEDHLLGSLVTGVSHFASVGISDHLNDVPAYKWVLAETGRFVGYYGLGDDELAALLEHVFPDEEQKPRSVLEEVVDFYKGYHFGDKVVYCLWSVLHYIQERKKKDASEVGKKTLWGKCTIMNTMGNLLRNGEIMEKMIDLMGENYISFKPYEKLDAQDLANFIEDKDCGDSDLVLSFFLEQGYLSRVPPDQRDNVGSSTENLRVKVPNAEVLVGYKEMFRNYCSVICGLSDNRMKECARIFKDMSTNTTIEKFNENLRYFHYELNKLLSKVDRRVDVDERSIQAVMHTVMLKRDFEECRVAKSFTVETENGEKTGKIDLWILHKDFAVIWKFASNRNSIKESSRQACSDILFGSEYQEVPPVKILDQFGDKLKNYLLIGLSIDNERKLCMCCLLNSQDLDHCIFSPEDDRSD